MIRIPIQSNMVKYYTILKTTMEWLCQNIDQIWNSENTPIILDLMRELWGVQFEYIWEYRYCYNSTALCLQRFLNWKCFNKVSLCPLSCFTEKVQFKKKYFLKQRYAYKCMNSSCLCANISIEIKQRFMALVPILCIRWACNLFTM